MSTANQIGFGVCLAFACYLVWQFLAWLGRMVPQKDPYPPTFLQQQMAAMVATHIYGMLTEYESDEEKEAMRNAQG